MSTPEPPAPQNPADSVSFGVRVAAAWSWRLLVVAGVLVLAGFLVVELSAVVIPVAVSLLVAALMTPGVGWLQGRGLSRGPATTIVLVGGIALLATVLTFVVQAFVNGLPDLTDQVSASLDTVQRWLVDGPLGLEQAQIDGAFTSFTDALTSNQDALTSGALSTASTLGHFVSGLAIALFTTIFFVYDGNRVWRFVLLAVPSRARPRVDVAGHRGFASLVGYVRATVAVAAVDAIGIGLGLFLLRVPLALPLAALVFLGAFVPIIGAFLTGFVAVFIALVTQGPVVALLVLAVVVAVQQLEAHVLQPLMLGRAVQLHPLAVVLAIAVGLVGAGIVGALLAVPLVAVLNAAIRSLAADEPPPLSDGIDPTDPDEGRPETDDPADDGPPSAQSSSDRSASARPA